LFPLAYEILKKLLKHISDGLAKNDQKSFDVKEVCNRFTTDVSSRCIFNIDARSFEKQKPEIREEGQKILKFSTWIVFWSIMNSLFSITKKFFRVKIMNDQVENFFLTLTLKAMKDHQMNRYIFLAHFMRNKKQLSEIDIAGHCFTTFIGASKEVC
jgi:hypothetical protein